MPEQIENWSTERITSAQGRLQTDPVSSHDPDWPAGFSGKER